MCHVQTLAEQQRSFDSITSLTLVSSDGATVGPRVVAFLKSVRAVPIESEQSEQKK
jgi:hypothetical protein